MPIKTSTARLLAYSLLTAPLLAFAGNLSAAVITQSADAGATLYVSGDYIGNDSTSQNVFLFDTFDATLGTLEQVIIDASTTQYLDVYIGNPTDTTMEFGFRSDHGDQLGGFSNGASVSFSENFEDRHGGEVESGESMKVTFEPHHSVKSVALSGDDLLAFIGDDPFYMNLGLWHDTG